MTAVARGAALYAGTAGLEARPARPRAPGAGLAVRIEHPPVTADLAPFVVGRFMPGPGEALPERVRIEREDGGFRTPDAALSAEGSFVLQVALTGTSRRGFVRGLRRCGWAGAARDRRVRDRARPVHRRSAAVALDRRGLRRRPGAGLLPEGDAAARAPDLRPTRSSDRRGERG